MTQYLKMEKIFHLLKAPHTFYRQCFELFILMLDFINIIITTEIKNNAKYTINTKNKQLNFYTALKI